MGNVCGCVRAEKEEQYLDPAKTPLSPDRRSPGRKYFRGQPTWKAVGNPASVQCKRKDEDTKSNVQLPGGQLALLCRAQAPTDAAVTSPTLEDGFQQETTQAVADRAEQRLVPTAVSSWSHEAKASPVKHREAEVQKSAPDTKSSERENLHCCAGRKEHADDVDAEVTFQRKAGVFSFRKASSLSSLHYGTEKSLEKSRFTENPSKTYSSVQKRQNTERFCPCETHHFQFKKRRCYSLGTVSSVSKDMLGSEVSEVQRLRLGCECSTWFCQTGRL